MMDPLCSIESYEVYQTQNDTTTYIEWNVSVNTTIANYTYIYIPSTAIVDIAIYTFYIKITSGNSTACT